MQSLIVPRDCGDPCGFERAIKAMSLFLPKVKRSTFLKISSSDTNKPILNTARVDAIDITYMDYLWTLENSIVFFFGVFQ